MDWHWYWTLRKRIQQSRKKRRMSFSSLWDCNAINPPSPPSQHSKLNNCPHPSALLPYIPFNWHIAPTHWEAHHKQIQCAYSARNEYKTHTEQADPLIHVPADKVHGGTHIETYYTSPEWGEEEGGINVSTLSWNFYRKVEVKWTTSQVDYRAVRLLLSTTIPWHQRIL